MITLKETIKRERAKLGLSQVELAKKLGYASGQFVSNWERGESFPPVDRLAKMSLVFNLDKDILVNLYIAELTEAKKKDYEKALNFHKNLT